MRRHGRTELWARLGVRIGARDPERPDPRDCGDVPGRLADATVAPTRRSVLASVGAGALAGCLSLGESPQFRAFERQIRARDVRVKRVAEDYRRWILEYYPEALTGEPFRAELGTIAGVYAETVPAADERPNHGSMKGILFDERTDRVGSYEVDAAWARARRAGELTREAYVERIEATRRE